MSIKYKGTKEIDDIIKLARPDKGQKMWYYICHENTPSGNITSSGRSTSPVRYRGWERGGVEVAVQKHDSDSFSLNNVE